VYTSLCCTQQQHQEQQQQAQADAINDVYDDDVAEDVAVDMADGNSPRLVHKHTTHIHAAALIQ
jgi:hypothetical protein